MNLEDSALPDDCFIKQDGTLTDFISQDIDDSKDESCVKFVACGDTGPVRKLERIVIEKGSYHVLGDLKSTLHNADVVFANLEAVYSNRGTPFDKIPVFRLDPAAFAVVKDANIKVASLANNHMLDYGANAFSDTVELLEGSGITYFGAGLTMDQAKQPAVLEIKGIKFGFIGFRDKESNNYDDNGVATPKIIKEDVIKTINKLRPSVDVLILSLHFGWEYQLTPSPKDVSLCRNFIDAGVDIILGHHPHYPQGIEKHNNGLIAYSLGNFIWDQNFSGHTCSSFVLELDITKKGIRSARVIPFEMNRNYQLQLSNNKNAINELNSISTVLYREERLNNEWYFICRNMFIITLKNLYYFITKKKQKMKHLNKWRNFILQPRSIYTWTSLLCYIFTFKSFKYETQRLVNKKNRI
jgi:poly-gamma-glutamate synthesis protein (capsule biosynthesis protein)